MARLEHRRHVILVFLSAVGLILVPAANALSGSTWLPWLDQGTLGIWLDERRLIYSSCIFGFLAILFHQDGRPRGIAISCLSALLTGILWALGQIGAVLLVSRWIPAPVNFLHLMLPILGGVLCCAPLLVALYMSAARRNRDISNSPPVGGATDSAVPERGV